MNVTPPQIAALRALLIGDADTMRLTAELGDAGMAGYQYLAEAALIRAARRRFAPAFTSADLVRFVASVRVSRLADGEVYDFDPVAAESVLRYALDQQATPVDDAGERFRAVIALLIALTEDSSNAGLDRFLAEAIIRADQ
jgi:hypothetical protein